MCKKASSGCDQKQRWGCAMLTPKRPDCRHSFKRTVAYPCSLRIRVSSVVHSTRREYREGLVDSMCKCVFPTLGHFHFAGH